MVVTGIPILGCINTTTKITMYVSLCLKACYMFHYQHFEVEIHLQYDKLRGARKANTKQPGCARAQGGRERRKRRRGLGKKGGEESRRSSP